MKALVSIMTLITLVSISSVQAAEITLFKITNEVETNTFKLILEVDKNKDAVKLHKDRYTAAGKKNERISYKVKNVDSKKGIALVKREGREIVRIKSDNFSSHKGGSIVVNVLSSGVLGSRKDYQGFELVRNGNEWKVEKAGKKVKILHFVSRALAGKVIGIKNLIVK